MAPVIVFCIITYYSMLLDHITSVDELKDEVKLNGNAQVETKHLTFIFQYSTEVNVSTFHQRLHSTRCSCSSVPSVLT